MNHLYNERKKRAQKIEALEKNSKELLLMLEVSETEKSKLKAEQVEIEMYLNKEKEKTALVTQALEECKKEFLDVLERSKVEMEKLGKVKESLQEIVENLRSQNNILQRAIKTADTNCGTSQGDGQNILSEIQ